MTNIMYYIAFYYLIKSIIMLYFALLKGLIIVS